MTTQLTPTEFKKPEPGKAFEARAKKYESDALAVKVIPNADSYKAACALFSSGSAVLKEFTAFFEPIKADSYETWQNNCKREKSVTDPIKAGKDHLGTLIANYDKEQEESRQKEEANQRKLAAKANDEQILAEAEALQAEGNAEAALALIDQGGMCTYSPVVPKSTPVIKGMHFRSNFKPQLKGKNDDERMASKRELINAVAVGTVPLSALDINWTYIRQRARTDKKLLKFPGIEVVEDRKPVGTGG